MVADGEQVHGKWRCLPKGDVNTSLSTLNQHRIGDAFHLIQILLLRPAALAN
jgi:hypothetical protein